MLNAQLSLIRRIPFTLVVALLLSANVSLAEQPARGIRGKITETSGIAIGNARIDLQGSYGVTINSIVTSANGEFWLTGVQTGDYVLVVTCAGFKEYQKPIHVDFAETTQLDLQLEPDEWSKKEMVVKVTAQRKLVQPKSAAQVTEVSHERITQLPKGENVELNDLIGETTPGIGESSLKMLTVHGVLGKVQYRVDGVALPDAPDNAFGESFSTKNIDHVDILTGGFAAEYGNRLDAVVDISTRSGADRDHGMAEINYGSYNTTSPFGMYSWSNPDGNRNYFLSFSYSQTDRGLDTPEPVNSSDVTRGGTAVVHDHSQKANALFKMDWVLDNENKTSLILAESYKFFQIPNYPSSFQITNPLFNSQDPYSNGPYLYTPPNTNDRQTQNDTTAQIVWKHTISENSFLQTGGSYKLSAVHFDNDPTNDLYSVTGAQAIAGATAASFAENRYVNNYAVQSDYTRLIEDVHRIKMGIRLQASQADGGISVIAATTGSPAVSSSLADLSTAYYESVYLQDDYSLSKSLVLNVGMRFDDVQFHFPATLQQGNALQPRAGLNYMATSTTKLHAFYGRFFQSAPVDDFRASFSALQSLAASQCPPGQLCPYDIKAEVDDSYELGVDQQLGATHVAKVNLFYRHGTNALDVTGLLNTNLQQPLNYAEQRNYGADFSLYGRISPKWSDYLNYSYSISQVRGISGGIFAIPPGQFPANTFVPLDEEQIHTLTSGVTYANAREWWTLQALFGSGFHTGPNNYHGLPGHFTMNTTVGYKFAPDGPLPGFKASLDATNVLDNHYVISLQNDFNYNHYAAGLELMAHLAKEF